MSEVSTRLDLTTDGFFVLGRRKESRPRPAVQQANYSASGYEPNEGERAAITRPVDVLTGLGRHLALHENSCGSRAQPAAISPMESYYSSRECYMYYMRSIEETLLRMYYACDSKQFHMLTERVFADEITTDYSAMFGWPPKTRTSAEQTESWRQVFETGIESSQHVITGILPLDMDWPVRGAPSLDRNTVTVTANVRAYLRKQTSDGKMLETDNSARGEFVMLRKIIVHAGGENIEWRVRSFKAYPVYDIGGKDFWSAP